MDGNKNVKWGRGLRGIFELQAFFPLIFPTEESFRENPSTFLGEKKLKQNFYRATLLARE